MTDQAASTPQLETGVSQLRCIACGAVGENGAKSVRCAQCGDLLEVVYPGWKTGADARGRAGRRRAQGTLAATPHFF